MCLHFGFYTNNGMDYLAIQLLFWTWIRFNMNIYVSGQQSSLDARSKSNLITILNPDEIGQLYSCLRKSNAGVDTRPYLTIDLWFELLGYFVETHKVTTEDGYILTVYRVMRQNPLSPHKRPVIFLNHGLSGSSNQWIVQEGKNNLAQVLADAGFEVWIGNCRGTSYSNTHVKLTLSDYKYWDFSWSEMGIYDVPAVIDKILNYTQQPQLNYISYSMGSTQYMVMLSQKPEYNAKIRKGFLLAPAGIINSATSPMRHLSISDIGKGEKYVKNFAGSGGSCGSHSDCLKYIKSKSENFGDTCSASSLINCGICANLIFYLAGFNPREMNYTALPSFYKNYADTVSIKSLVHYGQLMNDQEGKFRMFDYGAKKNKVIYGKSVPPCYDLKKITVPTYIYYGRGDNIVPYENVEQLAREFTPGVIKQMVLIDQQDPTNMFNHLDFITSVHAYQHFIRPILDVILNDYNLTRSM